VSKDIKILNLGIIKSSFEGKAPRILTAVTCKYIL
jgi:hypothetical protein